jgi:hypothetical protein
LAGGISENTSKSQSLRVTFRKQEAPPDLRQKVFEKFNIFDFENLRKNTRFEGEDFVPAPQKKERPKRKIFGDDQIDP